jgi:hypothetical protein
MTTDGDLNDQDNLRQDIRVQVLFPLKFAVWSSTELPTLTLRHQGLSAEAAVQVMDDTWELGAQAQIEDHLRSLLPLFNQLERKLNYIIQLLTQHREDENLPLAGEVIDLSGSGMRIITGAQISQGSLIETALRLPGLPISVPLVGSVQRVQASGQSHFPLEVAVNYVVIHEIDRERIIRYIFQAQRQQLLSRTYRQSPATTSREDPSDERSE